MSTAPLRVLIVDDEPAIRRFLRTSLAAQGYLVIEADNLTDAAEISKGCPILEDGGSVEIRPIQQVNM